MSGSVLLDTNIVIGLFAVDSSVLSHLSKTDSIFIPSIVLGELYFGAYKSARPDDDVRRINELLLTSTSFPVTRQQRRITARSKRFCVSGAGR
ncbi:MAG: hypothetical protein OEY86_16140 [Nitrospira sp.]|nr:hypothetical protein [Nitrospira sp.]